MSDEDCLLLDVPNRPENLLMQVVPVAPVCIRPSVEMDAMGSNEDDITMKLMVGGVGGCLLCERGWGVTGKAELGGVVGVCCGRGGWGWGVYIFDACRMWQHHVR